MVRINRILVIFLLIIAIAFVGVWRFVQSESFAKILSENITKTSREKFGVDVKFEKLEFRFFPPGAELVNIDFKYAKDNFSVKLNALKAGVTFDMLDSFQTDLTIKKLYVVDGRLTIIAPQQGNKADIDVRQLSPRAYVSSALNVFEKQLPFKVRGVNLEDIAINYNDFNLYVRKVNSQIGKKEISLFGEADNIDLDRLIDKKVRIDRVYFDIAIRKRELDINNIEIVERFNRFGLNGTTTIPTRLRNIKYKLNTVAQVDLEDIHDYLDFKDIGEINYGSGDLNCEIKGVFETYRSVCDTKLKNFKSDFLVGEDANAVIEINRNEIRFHKLNIKDGEQRLGLKKDFQFYNFKKGTFVDENIYAKASKLKLTNALRFLKNELGMLSGLLSGEVEFTLEKEFFNFKFSDNTYVENLSLNPSGEREIIGAKNLKFKKTQIEVRNGDVLVNMDLSVEKSDVKIRGEISDGRVSFVADNAYVDFRELNKLAGFDFLGEGEMDVDVSGPFGDVKMKVNSKIKQFLFEGYNLDELDSKMILHLDKQYITISEATGSLGRSVVKGKGSINLDTLELGIDVYHPKLYYNDMRRIYYPLQKDLTFLPDRFVGEMKASMTIGGKMDLKDLKVVGDISGDNIFAYDESFDHVKMKFSLEQMDLNFNYIEVSKAKSKLLSIVNVDLETGITEIRGNVKTISLLDIVSFYKIPVQVKGDIDGNFHLVLDKGINKFDSQIYVNNSSVEGNKVGSSYVESEYSKDVLALRGNIFDKIIAFDSKINFDEKFWSTENESHLKLDFKLKDVSKFLPLVSGISDASSLDGRIFASLDSTYNFNNLKSFSSDFRLNELYIDRKPILLDYRGDNTPLIKVEKSEVKKWNVNLRGDDIFLISKANGNFLGDHEIDTKVKISASILELLDTFIKQSSGVVLGKISSYVRNDKSHSESILTTNNLGLSSPLLPTDIKSSKIKLSYHDRKVFFNKFILDLGNGNVDVGGFVNFNNIIPELFLKYKINQADLALMKKTNIEISGSGSVIGARPPYTINGDILITKAIIANEFTEFGGEKSIGAQKVKYLPESSTLTQNNMFAFNVSIVTQDPIQLKNSMASLAFTSNLQLLGSEVDPKLSGKVALASAENTITFQNNEFLISRGDIFFTETKPLNDPEVDFVANANISKYSVTARVYGPVSDFNTSLTSEPVLPQQNILSLIAFGYTEDLSDNLSDVEKESITRAGIGSLIFESFKINQALKNEFGIQLNVGTEISRNEGSYLSQRGAESTNSVGRVRSATKIEVKKEITEDVTMSVTSTVGGSTGERQSMNLSYNIDETYSVEGVYQSQTSDEDEQDTNANSMGADFKIKWSFK